MKPAAVGFQCPECVREGSRSVREARTAYGGRLSFQLGAVTNGLIALNVVVFVLQQTDSLLTLRYGLLGRLPPAGQGPAQIGVGAGEWYRLITAAFLHASPTHILFNMVALFQVGPIVERALGHVRYLALYLLCALGGSTLSLLVSDPGQLGVGASGAIFGLFGAYFVIVRRLGGDTSQILTLLVINLVIGFAVPQIDWRAHLGGLAVGAGLTYGLGLLARRPREQAVLCAVVLALLVAADVLRAQALGA